MRTLRAWLLCIGLTLAGASPVRGESASDPRLGFSLSVPDGFTQIPDAAHGDVIFTLVRPPSGNQKAGTAVVIRRLGGFIGREKINPKEFAASHPRATMETEHWKGFDIEVMRAPEQAGDLQLVTFNAQVPLKPEAIQISIGGEAIRENELRALLRSVLVSLDGQTNWLSTDERIQRFAEGITDLVLMVGVPLVITVVIWRAARKRRRKRRDAARPH